VRHKPFLNGVGIKDWHHSKVSERQNHLQQDDPILYRIIDFIELLELATAGKLRVSSSAMFSDVNELVGQLLALLGDASFHPLSDNGMQRKVEAHQKSKEAFFVSSWTKTKDSIAMWELYSPQKQSVQIGVRQSKIKKAFDRFSNESSFALGHKSNPNDGRVLFYPPIAGNCEYVNYSQMLDLVKEKYSKMESELEKFEVGSAAFSQRFSELNKERLLDVGKAVLFKDEAYSYENEYRFSLRAVTRNDRDYEECRKDPFFILTDSHLRSVNASDVGSNIFIPFESDQIDEVWLDGRIPSWKRVTIDRLLRDVGFQPQQSLAYGSFLELNHLKEPFY
jgi:hypothetical protein